MMAATRPMLVPATAARGAVALDPVYRHMRDLVYKISGIFQLEEKLYLMVDACGRQPTDAWPLFQVALFDNAVEVVAAGT